MTEPVSTLKLIVGTFTAVVVAPAAADSIMRAERMILGVPQSVLLVAVAGALIGVLLLPEREADRLSADTSRQPGHRALQLLARLCALAAAVIGYALIAAWLIAVAATWFPSLAGAPQLPLAGISGVLIRRMLPSYLNVVERVTGAIGARAP